MQRRKARSAVATVGATGSLGVKPPRIDLAALSQQLSVELEPAIAQLRALYDEIDVRNKENTATLNLPCHRGCDACCKESVFLTPLEFLAVWDWVQKNFSDEQIAAVIKKGLQL